MLHFAHVSHGNGKILNRSLLLVAAAGFAVSFFFWHAGMQLSRFRKRSSGYDALIVKTARRHGVDPRLVKAVIWRESSFRPLTVGEAGEVGLMQIMPRLSAQDWSRKFHREIPCSAVLFSPELNIEIGTWYLASALRRWSGYKHCEKLALCEYNAGLARARAWKPAGTEEDVVQKITISSTRAYVISIMKQYEKYQKEWKIQ